jgi:hypothetical protein
MRKVKNGIKLNTDKLRDDIIRLSGEGKRPREICMILNESINTVDYYRRLYKAQWFKVLKDKEHKLMIEVTKPCPRCDGRNNKENTECIYCGLKLNENKI